MIDKLIKKFKEFYDDKIGMLIVVSWAVLIVCLIIKLFGGNWFELYSENGKFIAFCNYVDETLWLKRTLACCVNIFTTYPVLCIALNKKYLSLLDVIIFIPLMIFKSFIGWYNTTIAFILDFVILLFIPIIMTKKILRPLLSVVLILALQVITLLLRNLSFGFGFNVGNTAIENLLYQVDYYIMIALCYLYNFKKKNLKEKELK